MSNNYTMSDSKKKTMVEVISGKIISFVIGIFINGLVFSIFQIDGDIILWSSLSAIFVLIAFVRSFLWRRLFNWLGEDFLK